MDKVKKNLGVIFIILAACFWGSMGIFVRRLTGYGFDPIQIVALRVTVAALIFSGILFFKEPKGFKIAPKDIVLFMGLGWGSILFFTICYFTAITIMPLSTAAILLYTSPIWIMLMAAVVFREKITFKKLVALILAFGGCVLVSGISGERIPLKGLALGLGSGLGYGLYSILGTVALRKYSPYVVTAYTFLFAAAGSWVVCKPGEMIRILAKTESLAPLILLCVLTGIITAVIPFLFYTLGLRSTDASKAGILATIEPMVATVIGVIAFNEALTAFSAVGIVLILAASVILSK
ncbi:MAG: DMT family transporter [Lachnospiraceae bacterium]|nr:DMT family transporter [Lachnospiraceae bacterium]